MREQLRGPARPFFDAAFERPVLAELGIVDAGSPRRPTGVSTSTPGEGLGTAASTTSIRPRSGFAPTSERGRRRRRAPRRRVASSRDAREYHMNSYHVFGGVLRSELEFPELDVATRGEPDWTLNVTFTPAPDVPLGAPLGEDRVDVDVMVRSYATPVGIPARLRRHRRLRRERGGVARFAGIAPRAADAEAGRLDVLGRVLALALHASGWLSLHGSAVALGDGAVAFLAPKGNGKSTLAFALMRAGAALMTDDTVVIEPGARRSYGRACRAFDSSAIPPIGCRRQRRSPGSSDIKATFGQLAADARRLTRAPLAALYLLESVPAGTIDRAGRARAHRRTRGRLPAAHADEDRHVARRRAKRPPCSIPSSASPRDLRCIAFASRGTTSSCSRSSSGSSGGTGASAHVRCLSSAPPPEARRIASTSLAKCTITRVMRGTDESVADVQNGRQMSVICS